MIAIKVGVLLGLCVLAQSRSIEKDLFQLTVVHINDFHARYEETNPLSGPCKDPTQCIAGFSRLYKELNSHKNRPNVLFLNAGDNFQGTLWYNIFGWNVTQYFLNKLPADVYTLGNHEFDNKIAGVVPFIKALKKPVVLANIDDSMHQEIQNTYKKSTVITRGGKKIGIIGVIASNTNELSQTENIKFLDEVESINKEVKNLLHCDIIIVLSHCGLEADMKIATKISPRINLIVGGHSHSLLYNGPAPGVDQPVAPYPVVVDRPDGGKVLVVQASSYSKYVGNLTVFYDRAGKIVKWHGTPIYLSHDKPQDAAINEELKVWKTQVDLYGKRVVGQSNVLLSQANCHREECNIGDFFADAMVDHFKPKAEPNTWNYVSVGLINSGGLRISLTKGNITFNDLATCTPFGTTIDVGELTGEEIKQSLEYSVSKTVLRRSYDFWQFMQVSGLRFTADLAEPQGSRIKNLQVLCQACPAPVFKPYEPAALYRVAMPSFVVNGGDGYNVIRDNIRNLKKGDVDIQVFEEYIKKMSPINQGTDGRINVINDFPSVKEVISRTILIENV